ncbi:hypothetical protein FNH22_13280 [Fulvivirga sp. M361]|uniref:hypothetical protein n=1 Tax=Fulvivirga sp. M361 TaxID=2594266 RepID=UPI00117A24E6|nr:hypothetical protein [Fulvivirga sp. M361]TRX58841.1 hypothetical protein FNH22_13280 [Fulvivirga sp. M361]
MDILPPLRIPIICMAPLLFFSCEDEKNEAELIVDPAGSARYFVNNQSATDLMIIFTKSTSLGMEIDSSKKVTRNDSKLLFSYGDIGINPLPSDAFTEIQFYELSNSFTDPLLVISPISNDNWNILDQNLEENGFGLTDFELVIRDQDLN